MARANASVGETFQQLAELANNLKELNHALLTRPLTETEKKWAAVNTSKASTRLSVVHPPPPLSSTRG